MAETFYAMRDQLVDSFRDMVLGIAAAMPRILTGLVLILVLLFVAKIVASLLRKILKKLRLDALSKTAGIDQTLSRLGVRAPLSDVLSRSAYFLLLFLFAQAVVDGLGVAVVANAMGTFLGYLPNLVAAIFILIAGSVAAQFGGGAIARAAESSGIEFGASLGSMVSGLILFVAGIMAVGQLQVDTQIVRIVTICLLAGLGLGFGLSFGLGTKDITSDIISGFYARKVFRIGEPLEVRGHRGVLKSITPTMTLLDNDGETIAFSNREYQSEIIKQ